MILEDLLQTLDVNTRIREIRQGVFHTAVLTRYCGLAASLPREALAQTPPLVKEAGHLAQKSASALAEMVFSDSILEAAIGMATINSLLVRNDGDAVELNAAELICRRSEGKNVVIVGHFPFIPKVREVARRLWVIEKHPQKGDASASAAADLIPRAEVLAVTGSSFTNHTFEDLTALKPRRAFAVVLGDSAPLSPVLFDYGVDAVCGTRVVDAERAMQCVCEGANFRQIKGVQRLTMLKSRESD